MRLNSFGLAAGIAALATVTPAAAGTPDEPFVGIPNAKPPTIDSGLNLGFGQPVFVHPGFGSGDSDGRHRRGRIDVGVGTWVNGGEWARWNNQGFRSDSYNDWWHDQPWRSQPAWVRNNQSCRAYWSGGGWRC